MTDASLLRSLGLIVITSDLFGRAVSDSEIAAVLAHEIAHALANHARERSSTIALGSVILAPLISVFVVAAIFNLVEIQSIVNPMRLTHLVCMYRRRRQEEEADYISTFLMVDAGFDPSALLSIFEKIKKFEDQVLSDEPTIQQVPQWMRTHPDVS